MDAKIAPQRVIIASDFTVQKTKAQIPQNVQQAIALSHGKAHFNTTVTGQSITWGTEAFGQKW